MVHSPVLTEVGTRMH